MLTLLVPGVGMGATAGVAVSGPALQNQIRSAGRSGLRFDHQLTILMAILLSAFR